MGASALARQATTSNARCHEQSATTGSVEQIPSHPTVVTKPICSSVAASSALAGSKLLKLRNVQQFHALWSA
eukprot:scaffold23680_cov87-Phaeocystis_antarctica.AAC.1